MDKSYVDGLLRAIRIIDIAQRTTIDSNIIAAVGMEQVKILIENEIGCVNNMKIMIKQGQVYRHFKGKLYKIIGLSEDTETGECFVVFQALYEGHKIYHRPYSMFTSKVDKEKYPNVDQENRFELVHDNINFELNYIDLDVTVATQIEKLREECGELLDAVVNRDTENILEESMDTIQVVLGLIQTMGLQEEFIYYNSKHQEKLRSRGHILTDIMDTRL